VTKVDPAVFKGRKIVLSTPTMGMSVCEQFCDSFAELTRWLNALGVSCAPHRVRDTLLVRARNVLAAEFLATEAEWQLWLDSDMGWDTADVVRMLYHALTNPEIEIIGAAYPQKHIDWERVKEAARGKRSITPNQLACASTGSWTMKGLSEGNHDIGIPQELRQIGEQPPHVATGMMLVKRSAYERLKASTPSYFDSRQQKDIWRFFHCDIEDGLYLGEDTWFCRRHVEAGGKLWGALWVKTDHIGMMAFPGNVSEVMDADMPLPA
jgi:hypothetical protein